MYYLRPANKELFIKFDRLTQFRKTFDYWLLMQYIGTLEEQLQEQNNAHHKLEIKTIRRVS